MRLCLKRALPQSELPYVQLRAQVGVFPMPSLRCRGDLCGDALMFVKFSEHAQNERGGVEDVYDDARSKQP